jgi:RNA polymerase sigma-70 factor, ECF subfamily
VEDVTFARERHVVMGRRPGQDAELVARAREGDLDAFERLIARHRARVAGIAWQLARDRESAQDIAQETLIRAFRALPSLRDGERFGAWLNTITRRVAAHHLRDGNHQPQPLDGELARGLPVLWGPPPEPPSELVDRVRAALEVLSSRERRAMILHYLEGRSCEEIAAELGVSNGSVRLLLHYSRRKVRKEAEAMAEVERTNGPRELSVWVDGYPGPGQGNLFQHLRGSLPQTICLAVNKRPKTLVQLAEDVDANPAYVQEVVADLLEMEVLIAPAKGQYLANFIAFDAEDWRRLMKLVPDPAGEVAKRLAAAEPRLAAAFAEAPVGGLGWTWEELKWITYAVLTTNIGASRAEPESWRLPRPERPGGGRYWLGGMEWSKQAAVTWSAIGFHSNHSPGGLGNGYFPAGMFRRPNPPYIEPVSDQATLVEALADGPLPESELLGRLGGEAEHWRGVLADLVSIGYVAQRDGRYRLLIPVFTQGDSDVLVPAIEEVMRPIADEVVVPALFGLPTLLTEMGYGHARDQFPQWQRWVGGSIMAEAVHFLLEQGVLSRPPDPVPPSFGFIAWKGDLRLMSWGV